MRVTHSLEVVGVDYINYYNICTYIAGAAGVVAGHPLDTVKVRLQTQHDHRYRNSFHCLWSTLKREGVVHGLFKGMSSPMCGLAITNAIIFGVYGNTLRLFDDRTSIVAHFCAGSLLISSHIAIESSSNNIIEIH